VVAARTGPAPPPATAAPAPPRRFGAATLIRSPAGPVTGCAFSPCGATLWVVTKGGAALRVEVGSGRVARLRLDGAAGRRPPGGSAHSKGGTKRPAADPSSSPAAPWARRPGRTVPPQALLAVAASDDGRLVAVGGGDGLIRVWEARTAAAGGGGREAPSAAAAARGAPAMPPSPPPSAILSGHRGPVTGLAFRPGAAAAGHALFSCAMDGTVKLWSPSEGGGSAAPSPAALVDTLFGHAGPALAVSAAPRAERATSGGADRTARVWKVADGAQLLFRSPGQACDAVAHVSPTEWVSGGPDGGVALWSQLKKRPAAVVRRAHAGGGGAAAAAVVAPAVEGEAGEAGEAAASAAAAAPPPPPPSSDASLSWVGAVAVAAGTDLAASGGGDGAVRLWAVRGVSGAGGGGARRTLDPVASLPVPPGFVNGLALARSGLLAAVGLGTEPRLGRWGRAGKGAWNGVVLHPLVVSEEGGGGGL